MNSLHHCSFFVILSFKRVIAEDASGACGPEHVRQVLHRRLVHCLAGLAAKALTNSKNPPRSRTVVPGPENGTSTSGSARRARRFVALGFLRAFIGFYS